MSDAAQSLCESYDRVEIPEIRPDVTRVCLYGGVCPCCARRFKAEPPEGLEPGSPFGPNLRAFVVYLRSVQGIPLARLSHVLRDLFGLEISEGALVNILSASRKPFTAQTSLIKARLMAGTALASDETGMRVGKANWWLWVFHHRDSATSPPPTTARRGRCAPAPSIARSPTAFAANGAPRSTSISDPSSKPHGEDQSEPSTPSASPSKAAPSLAQRENATRDLSNYK